MHRLRLHWSLCEFCPADELKDFFPSDELAGQGVTNAQAAQKPENNWALVSKIWRKNRQEVFSSEHEASYSKRVVIGFAQFLNPSRSCCKPTACHLF